MSILIKGLTMPKSCGECIFDVWGGCLINLNTEPKNKLTHSCPLIELTDHGDLIDKTDLMASLADWQLSEAPEEGINWDSGRNVTSHELQYSIYRLLGDVYEEVRDEPVVIPAERSEDAQKAN